jgi:plasmid stabilization system protein ParE
MTRTVVWSLTAIDDFNKATEYLADRNPHAARRVAAAIDEVASKLGDLPTGRPGRVEDTYEKPVPRTPYVIAYAMPDTETLVIVRVIHMARDWPEGAWPSST